MEKGHTDQNQGSDIAGKGKTMVHWIEEDAAVNTFANFQRLCVEALVPRVTLYGGGGASLNIFRHWVCNLRDCVVPASPPYSLQLLGHELKASLLKVPATMATSPKAVGQPNLDQNL